LEDINTNDLKYLLVEFYIAELRQKAPIETRYRQLLAARLGLEQFIRSGIRLGLISKSDTVALGIDAVTDDMDNTAESSATTSNSASARRTARGYEPAYDELGISSAPATRRIDPARSRQTKIERFKQNQQVKKQLGELHALHSRKLAMARRIEDLEEDGVGMLQHVRAMGQRPKTSAYTVPELVKAKLHVVLFL
jgi:hypothetical protein